MRIPKMISKGNSPLAIFPVNSNYVLAVYKGGLSDYDILLKYRQKDASRKSGWSRIRTPKHIHWAVDVLLKMHADAETTKLFLDSLINSWDKSIEPLKTDEARTTLLNVDKLLNAVRLEARKYETISDKGEYNMDFLILIAYLLMIQEKTNLAKAYMFKRLLEALKEGQDIFKTVSIASHRRRTGS